MSSMNDYQEAALKTAQYPKIEGCGDRNLVYPAMGLAGEAGEYLDKVKKLWRNRGLMTAETLTDAERVAMAKELGDVLWYIAASAYELGFTMSAIASMNIAKLNDRHERGVIKSEGDNR